jgi:hypothetical protein
MSEIISKVTPLSRGLIWLASHITPSSETYKAIDYLANGLLTATLSQTRNFETLVIHAQNYHFPLHIFVVRELKETEFESYLSLLKPNLLSENNILVIDERDGLGELLKSSPKDIQSHYQILK